MNRILFFILFSFLGFTTQAQSAENLIPRADLFAPADKRDVQLSPKADKISYLVGTELYCVLPATPDSAIRIDTDGPVSGYKWLPENQVVGVMNIEGNDRIFISDVDNESPITILPEEFATARILATSPTLIENAVAALTFADTAKNGIYRVDLHYGKLSLLELPAEYSRFFFDKNLEAVAAAAPQGLYYDRIAWKTPKGKWAEIVQTDSTGIDTIGRTMQQAMGVSHDGSKFYYVNNFGREFTALQVMDMRRGKSRILKTAPNHDLLWAGALTNNSSNVPEAVVGYYGEMKRYFLDRSSEVDFQMIGMAQKGDVSFVGRSANDQFWLIRIMDGGPLKYYLYDKAMLQAQYLFSDHSILDKYELAERSPLVIEARDGVQLPCQVYLPAGSDKDHDGVPDEPLPTVMYVHGGPWIGFLNNSWFSNRNFQLLANRGYAVVVAEFRSATGYGRIFLEKSRLEWGGKMQDDLEDIAKSVKAKGIAAEDRLAIWGWSYGGYATLASLAYRPDEYACGIGMYGVYDLDAFTSLLPPDEEWWSRYVGDRTTEEGLKLLKAHSPVNYADQIEKPLLLTHGGQDQVTPQSQTDAMLAALKKAGRNDIRYFVIPNEPHNFRQPASWEAFWAISEQFLGMHLGGRFEPAGTDITDVEMDIVAGEEWIKELK